jgi:hypothetical protein
LVNLTQTEKHVLFAQFFWRPIKSPSQNIPFVPSGCCQVWICQRHVHITNELTHRMCYLPLPFMS